ncbi:hydrogenase expression protein HupH [Gordonia sp. zg691]|uniref:aspartate/glutamate racemase family protein n=1 Tax=Gordonia jinghuaiqii TaxID=2758710 RepID=UPI00166224C9|nr:aspartate/glutamate racemase family protein [Gordonia jinghuaiqii]MBD0861927.1 hydrogenase expression protein HupH [Gordonia jinghuaiqii]
MTSSSSRGGNGIAIKVIVPFPLPADAVRRRAHQLSPEMLGENVTVTYVPVRGGGSLADSAYDNFLIEWGVIEAGLTAQDEGYDAVCIDTASDSGLAVLRSRLDIPVVGPGEVAMHVATMLGRKFSIISTFDRWAHNCRRNAVTYGMTHALASTRSLSDNAPDVERLLTDKPEVIDALCALAERAVAEDGADIVVLASTTMHQAVPVLRERLTVPVVDPGPWSVRLAVDMVSLGVTHSRRAFPAPGVLDDAMIRLLPGNPVGAEGSAAISGTSQRRRYDDKTGVTD